MIHRLDPTFVRRRRHQLGLTKLQLARLAAVSVTTVEHAEEHGAPIYNPATLQLSNQLGIDLASPDPSVATPTDLEILGAILADLNEPVPAQAIAGTLDWSVEHVHTIAAQLRRELQPLGQTVTKSAADELSLAAYPLKLTNRQRKQLRSRTLAVDITSACVVLQIIDGSRRDRYWGAFDPGAQHAATELIAAGAITTYHDLLRPSEPLENAVGNHHLIELRW